MSEKEIELNNPDVFAQPAEQPETENNETEAETQESVSEEPEVSEETESHVTFIEADGEPQADEPTEEESGGESELLDDNSRELNEEQVEQLSLLDGQLPHLEAANAPDPRKAKAVLEGLLFITGDEGVTAEQAATALDITPELVAEYFDELMEEYTDDNRGIEIANYAGTYRFLSKVFVFDYAKRLFQITKTAQLSQAALETLAIIAYKQPITRVEIEEIRGVGADMMLRKLMARDLIRESGRSEAAGRPILYEVTEEFMNSFKLLSLKELPELPSFSNEEESEELFNQ
ncbi:MAG: SMC-Scp complex subunit ScpB [Solobacterium sp.]|nr:SMC-Scp complex subunit ScpB [Solobacterium sp.]